MDIIKAVGTKSISERLEENNKYYAALMRTKRKMTSQIVGDNNEEKIVSLCKKFNFSAKKTKEISANLVQILETKEGQIFFDDKIDEINRESFHKGAFLANAGVQTLTVNLLDAGLVLKAAFVTANLGLSFYAHRNMHKAKKALLDGPIKVPPKPAGPTPNPDKWKLFRWIFGGKSKKRLTAELEYKQKHLDYHEAKEKRDKPYKASSRREFVYASGYAMNAVTQLTGTSPINNYIIDLPLIDDAIALTINFAAAGANSIAGISSLVKSGNLNGGARESKNTLSL